ncbi:nucleoporin sonb like protein, partial [Teratosphaeria destructans]
RLAFWWKHRNIGSTTFGGGFGSNNANSSSPFGAAKPAFGAPASTSSGGGLFGGGTSTSGGFGSNAGGGFGSSNTTSAFGGNTGGGLFSAKPATSGFGSTNTGGSLFGGGSTSGGFGNAGSSNPFSLSTNNNSNAGGGFAGFGGTSAAGNNNNGTAAVPFNPTNEKDTANGATQAYQSISFQDPCKNKSFEELRVEDYAQGRRYGNTNGQAGSFGTTTGFGGFNSSASNTNTGGSTFGGFGGSGSNTGGGLFGNQAANTNSAGGLFGAQNKPAGGSLFGNTASSAPSTGFGTSTANSGGGLFGNNTSNTSNPFGASSNTGGGLFGGNNNQTTNTGGGLFGNNATNQNKPAFGGFGTSTQQNQQQSNPFGASSTNTGGGLFGGQNQQNQQQSNPFGGASNTNTGGGLFGNKPAGGGLFGSTSNTNSGGGLFGNSTTNNTSGGGLFGNSTNNNNPGGGLFGNNQQQNNTGGGLFGNNANQNKPAGTGLFGNSTSGTNTGGGLFGNNNTSNTGGSSLFGNTQNKPAGTSLFGGSTNAGGGGLFGNTGNQQQNTGGGLFGGGGSTAGTSLFGGGQSHQQGNSLFGGNQSQQQQQQNHLTASLTGSPYGNEELFASLAAPSPPVGPLATPLQGAKPAPRKAPSLMASMRINTPVYTPRGGAGSLGKSTGYGFTYSTYGTPGSAYSGSLTPGASSMLKSTSSFSSALTSRLNKSFSMGNLRSDSGTPGLGADRPSLLRESALSPPGSGRYSSGSVRKLTIDRSLRTDLFGPPSKAGAEETPQKSVTFQKTAREDPSSSSNALVRTEINEDSQGEESPGLHRAPPRPQPNGRPEMAQTNGTGSALGTVPEDSAPRSSSAPATQQKPAAQPNYIVKGANGEYYMEPPVRDLKNMSRKQLQNLGKLTVGRYGYGWIEFQGPIDLSTVPLNHICGDIVQLTTRQATVYKDDTEKPMMGRGLNVPSIIHLENSWPRSHGGKRAVNATEGRLLEKHIQRLQKVGGTRFEKYDPKTGIWTFRVDHFTTYGLDDDDDDEDMEEHVGESSGLSEPPETPDQGGDDTVQSFATGADNEMDEQPDDTFEFQLKRQSHRVSIPGADPDVSFDYDDPSADEGMESDEPVDQTQDMENPFTSSDGGAVQALSPGAVERYHSSIMEDDEVDEVEQEMPGAFAPEPQPPKSILKTRPTMTSPEKLATDSWEDQLLRTVNPKKRDRQQLKDMQQGFLRAKEQDGALDSPLKQSLFGRSMMGRSTGPGLGDSYLATKSAKKGTSGREDLGKSQAFKTSMDIMNSLWATENKAPGFGARTGFEYPYPKKTRLSTSAEIDEADVAFHNRVKPSFNPSTGILAYDAVPATPPISEGLAPAMQALVGAHKDVRFARFVPAEDLDAATLEAQKSVTTISEAQGGAMPLASIEGSNVMFAGAVSQLDRSLPAELSARSTSAKQELAIWQLCSILFDPIEVSAGQILEQVPEEKRDLFAERMMLASFKAFWAFVVESIADEGVKRAATSEEKAIALLTKGDVGGACEVLVGNRENRLAVLISQLEHTSKEMKEVMLKQIKSWQARKDWSEMSDAVRALYSILAGEVCKVPGSLPRAAAEDQADSFCIADRFGLSWQQSLALRVLYGGHDSLIDAVKAYTTDLHADNSAEPRPTSMWPVADAKDAGDDTLFSLCELYASGSRTEGDQLFEPQAVSGSAFNSRLPWQLAILLRAKGIVAVSRDNMALLTVNFADELESAGRVADAARILLHLDDDRARQRAIEGLLARQAGNLGDPPTETEEPNTFSHLSEDLNIPQEMLYAAKSVYAKATGNPLQQARYLLRSNNLDAAHEVLIHTVGPRAMIEQDFDALSTLIRSFPSTRHPVGWQFGGAVYLHLVQLLSMNYSRRHGPEGERLVQDLRRGVEGMEDEVGARGKGAGLERKVAVREIRELVESVARDVLQECEDAGVDGMSVDGDVVGGRGLEMFEAFRRAMGGVV